MRHVSSRVASRSFLAALIAWLVVSIDCRQASAQAWPLQPIHVVVPYVAGGAVDAFARILANKLQEQMKVPVIIDNRAGAGGNIGTNLVARAAPDGYTVLLNINGQAISPAIYKSLPFDADKDFIRVTQLVSTTTMLVATPSLKAKTLPEFVALAKANPNKLNYGSTGVGNALHLTMEMLKHETGIDIQMVPFSGDAPLFIAMLGGEVQVAFVPALTAKAHIESGALRAIAVTTAHRAPAFPSVPTIAEQGLADFIVSGWMGLFVPTGTPKDIVDRLWRESKIALAAPDVAPLLDSLGLEAVASSPEEFDAAYRADRAKFQRVIKEAHIPLQD